MFSQNMCHPKLGFKCRILKCVLLYIDSACFVSLVGLLQCHNSWSCFLQMKHAVAAAISVKAFGSLLFIFGSSVGAYLLVRHLVYWILH
jgi:hypothetical protein